MKGALFGARLRPPARSARYGADGTLHHYILIDWDDVPQETAGYGVRVEDEHGDVRFYKADDSKFKVPAKDQTDYTVQVRTRASGNNEASEWSAPQTITVTKKGAAPTTPTELTVVGKHRRAVVKTEDHPDRDFRRWNFYYSTTNLFSSATKTKHSRSNRFVVDDLDNKQTYYGWITAEDASGNESAKYPSSNTGGISFTTVKLDDDDTDDATLAAPTGLTLTKVQDTDEDGKTQTFIKMTCTAPAWATAKTTYVFAVTVGSDTFTVKSDDETARYRVNKTGVLHTVKVRGIKGNGNKGDWSGNQTITPTKKSAAPSTASSLSALAKLKGTRLRWARSTDPDYRETIIYRATSNSFGAAVEIDRVKGTTVIDNDSLTAGSTYYYWVAHVDNSGNIGSPSSVASAAFAQVDTDDINQGANSRVDEAYTAANYGTFGAVTTQTIQSVVSHHRDNGAQTTNAILAIGSFRNTSGAVATFDVSIERAGPAGDIVVATMPNYSVRDNEYASITAIAVNPGGDTVNGADNTFKLKVLGAAAGNNVANRRLQTIALRT